MRLDSGAPLCLCFAASDFGRCDSCLIWGSEFDFPPFCLPRFVRVAVLITIPASLFLRFSVGAFRLGDSDP